MVPTTSSKFVLLMLGTILVAASVKAENDVCYTRCIRFCKEEYHYNIVWCATGCIDACLAYSVEFKKVSPDSPLAADKVKTLMEAYARANPVNYAPTGTPSGPEAATSTPVHAPNGS